MAETTNNSLMKKTKAELIKIILRKDDVEVELQNANKTSNAIISDINKKLEDCLNANTVLKTTNVNAIQYDWSGNRRDVSKEHTYTYELNYLVDKKNNTYTLYSAYKDGIKMNEIEELILKIKAFDLCDVDIKADEK